MRLLVAVDGSRHALAALDHALALRAGGLDVQLVLVNVQEPPSLYEVVAEVVGPGAGTIAELDDVRRAAGADLLAAAEARCSAAGADWESEVAGGQPAALIAELAENYAVDAIALGARGVADPAAGRLGGVAQAVAARAGVPVTIVRAA